MFARRYFAPRHFARHYWGDGPDASIYDGPRPDPRWSTAVRRVEASPRPDPRWSTAVRRVDSSPKPDPRASTAQRRGDVPT